MGGALAYRDMVKFIDAHGIKPPIGQTFSFTESEAAYQAAASGEVFGKVVIRGRIDELCGIRSDGDLRKAA